MCFNWVTSWITAEYKIIKIYFKLQYEHGNTYFGPELSQGRIFQGISITAKLVRFTVPRSHVYD